MKYTVTKEIKLSRDEVIKLFDNFENLTQWQTGYKSYEHISGTRGEVGAKTKLFYNMNKRDITLIETITERDLPDKFSATYEMPGAWNYVENIFEETPSGTTLWISNVEFKLRGIMWLMGLISPGSFRKQSEKMMDNFKKWAEKDLEST